MSAPIIRSSRSSFDAVIGSDSAIVVDPNITVTRTTNDHTLDGLHVFMHGGFVAGDTLDVDASLIPSTVVKSWDATTGVLKLVLAAGVATGTHDAPFWQNLARNVKFTTTAISSGSKQVKFVLGEKLALEVGGSPRYYEFINQPGISWTEARAAAEARSFYGLPGYLAVITTEEEN